MPPSSGVDERRRTSLARAFRELDASRAGRLPRDVVTGLYQELRHYRELLEPAALLRQAEQDGDHTSRLALMEEAKTLPLGAVWQEHCRRQNVPGDHSWLAEVKNYERSVLASRN